MLASNLSHVAVPTSALFTLGMKQLDVLGGKFFTPASIESVLQVRAWVHLTCYARSYQTGQPLLVLISLCQSLSPHHSDCRAALNLLFWTCLSAEV